MNLSLDFGGSTIDAVFYDSSGVSGIESFDRYPYFKEDNLADFFRKAGLSFQGLQKIFVTGGKSSFFRKSFRSIPVVKIPEIEAIARGGYYLFQHSQDLSSFRNIKHFLTVSMGTGTCIVKVFLNKGRYVKAEHIGGTGFGGGTFLALSRILLDQTNVDRLNQLSLRGNLNKLDILVEDIIGKDFGSVPSTSTAAHLAKLMYGVSFSKQDLAAGLFNLFGQTFGVLFAFAAKASACELVLCTGKMTKMKIIRERLLEIAGRYGIIIKFPNNGEYVSAFGALA